MASSMPTSGPGRTFLMVAPVVAAGLGGFYLNMLRKRHRAEESGTNPMFEQRMGHVQFHPEGTAGIDPQPIRARASDIPPAGRRSEHYSGHSTSKNYKNIAGYAEHGEDIRRMVPPPQRPHNDGTGRAYTKSPDYVKNYGKTKRPEPEAAAAAI